MSEYANGSQQRLLRIVQALAGQELEGAKPSELAKAMEVSPGTITRDLANLEMAGWLETLDGTTRVRLTPLVGRIATTIQSGIQRGHRRLDEFSDRYSRRL